MLKYIIYFYYRLKKLKNIIYNKHNMGPGFYIGLVALLISIVGLIIDFRTTETKMGPGFYVGIGGALITAIGLLVDYILHCKVCCDDKNDKKNN